MLSLVIVYIAVNIHVLWQFANYRLAKKEI